jgi:SRSO17 transposase
MSLLETAEAQALFDEATVTPSQVLSCERRLTGFLSRFLPKFYRCEQRQTAGIVVKGLLGDLERKTCEPIARRAGLERKPVQFFVGAGRWDDEAVMAELRQYVTEERADPHGILIFDGSGFPKKGNASCGVKRQWCGRLGKIDNCQMGVFLAYATALGYAPLDRRLYLPRDWATDPKRRKQTHVPASVRYLPKWKIALAMLRQSKQLPHAWIAADDEFGRVAEFRESLRKQDKHYVLDVPSNTWIRDLAQPAPKGRTGGRPRSRPWMQAQVWAQKQAADRWQTFTVRDGTKGPLRVRALITPVQTRIQSRVGEEETLIVFTTVEATPRTVYALAHTPAHASLEELLRVAAARHHVEEMFEAAKGEAGLAHYEVRSWVGWHHHVTLSFLALWFLLLERERLGEKKPGANRAADTPDLCLPAAQKN